MNSSRSCNKLFRISYAHTSAVAKAWLGELSSLCCSNGFQFAIICHKLYVSPHNIIKNCCYTCYSVIKIIMASSSWQHDEDKHNTQEKLYKMLDKLKAMAREVPP